MTPLPPSSGVSSTDGATLFQEETLAAKLGAKVRVEITGDLKTSKVDFGKLLGFEMFGDQISDGLDWQDEALGAKLGA
jgi:hypothetical protein